MANFKWESLVLASGIALAGLLVGNGLNSVAGRDRTVTVKGLAEMEVKADKVTWPLTYKLLGSDINQLYTDIKLTNQKIVTFLKSKGIKDAEISVGAPEIVDTKADRYSNLVKPYRYNVTVVITVTSSQVDLVREMINEQSELLTQGVVITGDDYRYRVTYEFTSLNEVKPKMIEEATKNARKAADKFAEDSDCDLGGIQSASQGQFSIENRDASTPFIKKIRVVTTVNYLLEN